MVKRGLILLSVISLLFVTSCTRYANEEELTQLEQQKKAAISAEAKLSKLKSDRKGLEAKLAEKQSELQAAKDEKVAVEGRLKDMPAPTKTEE